MSPATTDSSSPGTSASALELPFLRRELVTLLGKRRAFWLLISVVVLSSLLPLSRWPSSATAGGPPRDTEWVLLLLFLTQLTAIFVVVPAITADTVAGERERGTYELLRAAPVRAASIVLPKVIVCVLYLFILLGSTAPAVSVFYYLGGVTFSALLECYAITALATTGAALIGLTASLRSRRTAEATLRGAACILLWNGGPLIIPMVALLALAQLLGLQKHGLWVELSARGLWTVLTQRLWAIVGVLAMLAASLVAAAVVALPSAGCSPHWAIYAALRGEAGMAWVSVFYGAYMSLVTIGHLIFLLDAAGLPEGHEARLTEDPFPRSGPASSPARRAARSVLAQVLLDLGESGVRGLRNPVFLRELRTELHGGILFRRGLFWGGLALALLLAAASGFPRSGWWQAVLVSTAGLAGLLLPAVTATALTRERELGNLDFLRGTQLSMRELLAGKLGAGVAALAGLLAAHGLVLLGGLAVLGPLLDAPPIAWASVLVGTLVVAATIALCASQSLLCSVLCQRSLPALLAAYATSVTLLLGAPLLGWLLPGPGRWPLALSPIFAILELGEGTSLASTWPALAFTAAALTTALGLWRAALRLAVSRLERER